MSFGSFLATLASTTLLVLLTYFGLQQFHITAGTLLDWLIGIGVLWWLAGVTILPWNAHFTAKDVVEEARVSREKGIAVNAETVAFANKLARRFGLLAVGLHVVSAAVLYVLARYQLLPLGYTAAIAALVLTFVRPAQRAYEHLSSRLRTMLHQIHYPREDVVELRNRVSVLEDDMRRIRTSLDAEETDSWAYTQAQTLAAIQRHLDRLDARLEETTRQNSRDHEALARQSTAEIARLSEDAQFLNQVRELIRFVKGV